LRSSAAADGGRCHGERHGVWGGKGVAILGRRGRRPLLEKSTAEEDAGDLVAILGRRGRRPLPVRGVDEHGCLRVVAILGRRGRRPLP